MVYRRTHYTPITAMKPAFLAVLVPGGERNYDGILYARKRHVRVVKDAELKDYFENKKRGFLEKKYGAMDEKEWHKFLFLIRLGNAFTKDDQDAIRKYISLYMEAVYTEEEKYSENHYLDETHWNQITKSHPRDAISSLMNDWLKKIHLTGWWPKNTNTLHVGIFCEDVTTGFFALWLSRINEARGLSICLKCNQPFEKSRKDQKFCNHKCQGAYATAKSRKKAKQLI